MYRAFVSVCLMVSVACLAFLTSDHLLSSATPVAAKARKFFGLPPTPVEVAVRVIAAGLGQLFGSANPLTPDGPIPNKLGIWAQMIEDIKRQQRDEANKPARERALEMLKQHENDKE